jgi:hypothetical protein
MWLRFEQKGTKLKDRKVSVCQHLKPFDINESPKRGKVYFNRKNRSITVLKNKVLEYKTKGGLKHDPGMKKPRGLGQVMHKESKELEWC